MTGRINQQELKELPPASAIKDPVVLKILDTIWAIMNDDRIKQWMEHGYGSSSPDIVGALDRYVEDAQELARELSQLFSQPLTDEERQEIEAKGQASTPEKAALTDEGLEKAIYQVLIDNTGKRRERYGGIEVTHIETNIGDSVKQLSTLLRPKIEQEREIVLKDVERIISWGEYEELPDGTKIRDGHIMSEAWQALNKEGG